MEKENVFVFRCSSIMSKAKRSTFRVQSSMLGPDGCSYIHIFYPNLILKFKTKHVVCMPRKPETY